MIELRITDQGIEGTIFDSQGALISTNRYHSEANLPSELRTKLSVLRLMDRASEVHGVGQKVSDTIFWIDEPYDSEKISNGEILSFLVVKSKAIVEAKSLTELIKESQHDTTRNLFNNN